jgi:dolichol-phosphate mannosyltransferase
VIAPVFNEAENMPELLRGWRELSKSISGYEFQFLLVDDGSSDSTAAAAEKIAMELGLSVRAIKHDINQGPGAAFATGFAALASAVQPDDIVVTMEGDNTSRIATLQTMIGRMEREGVPVALASPYAYGGGILNTSLLRVILSHFANGMIKGILDIHGIHTMSSFFRSFRGSVLLDLQRHWGPRVLERNGFECMVELLKKIILLQYSISEVPMKLDTSLRKGKSKMKILRTIRGYLAVMWLAGSWSRQF